MERITYLGLFQSGIHTRLKVAKVTEDALFKFFHVSDGSPEGFESEDQSTNNVGTSDMKDTRPEDA